MENIGRVTISYNKNTKQVYHHFEPTPRIVSKEEIDLEDLDCTKDESNIETRVKQAVSSWFNKMNDVELADRTQYEIKLIKVHIKYYHETKILKEAIYDVVLDKI